MKDIAKTAVVLCLIALVSGLLLGAVYNVTKVDPTEALNAKLNLAFDNTENDGYDAVEDFQNFKPEIVEKEEPIPIRRAFKKGSTADMIGVYKAKGYDNLYIYYTSSVGYKSGVELMIVVEDNIIKKIFKVAASETYTAPFEDGYLSQYYGMDLLKISKFNLVKEPSDADTDIEAVTSATKSSTAILDAVNLTAGYHKNLMGGANNAK